MKTHCPMFLLICLAFLAGCSPKDIGKTGKTGNSLPQTESINPLPNNSNRVTITQGVWGDVLFISGDPSSVDGGRVEPVSRLVAIYQPTTLKDVNWVRSELGTFIGKIGASIIDSVRADSSGFFQITLSTGEYSLFVQEGNFWWANHWNTRGILANFGVYENRTTYFRVIIDYESEG